jgi:hypothetical protein
MVVFKTRYGQAIVRILQTYAPGTPSLYVAIEALVQTAMGNVKQDARDEISNEVCQNLHDGPAKGLVCKRCFDALEMGKLPPEEEVGIPVPGTEAVETTSQAAERSAIEEQVRMLIGTGDDGGE